MLKKLTLGTVALIVLVNVVIVAVVLFTSRDRDLTVADTAIEWQEAVFGGNYEGMWDLSAPEYRNGLTRDEFISQARENAPSQDRIFDWTALNETSEEIARAHTRIQLARSGIETHRLMLRKIGGEWRVTEYASYDGPWPPDEPPLTSS